MIHSMRVYMDMCCLKRPFDDQAQPRISLETAATLAILQAVNDGRLEAVRSLAHEIENAQNPDSRRAGAVAEFLKTLNALEQTSSSVEENVGKLHAVGFRNLDAYHLAWAEY